jgi:hypothetical protein
MMSFPEYMNKFIMGIYILALKLLHEVVTHLGYSYGVSGSDVYSIFKPGFIQKPEIRIQVE